MASSIAVEAVWAGSIPHLLETSEAVDGEESSLSMQKRLKYVWLA